MSTKSVFVLLLALAAFFSKGVSGQSILNPADTVYTYNSSSAAGSRTNPTQPAANTIGKWIRTVRMSWNTSNWKCYVYNGVPFRLRFPTSYNPTANDGKQYPMLVFFHGLGEAGPVTDNEYQLYHGGNVFESQVASGAFDGFVLCMQSTGSWGATHNVYIKAIIDYMIANNKLSPFRIAVNGLSAGGYNSWNFMETYPSYVTTALPMSGISIYDEQYVSSYKYTPIWYFQGGLDGAPAQNTADQVVGVENQNGGNIKYTIYADLGHGTWDRAWSEPDFFPWLGRQYMSNPWTLFGRTLFCPGDAINVTMGVAPGNAAYQWRKDGVALSATGNSINVTVAGTYDCRIKSAAGIWSDWSHVPVVIGIKPPTVTPNIAVKGLMSKVIPAIDNNGVTLALPTGYATYVWQKVGSTTTLSTTNTLNVTTPGNYIAQVTEQFGCSSSFSSPFTVVDAAGPNKPDAASGLIASTVSQTSLLLNWSQNPSPTNNETNFEIYGGTKAGGPYKLMDITGADISKDTIKNLLSGTKYYFVVRAVDNTGAAAASNEASGTTVADVQPPTAPANLTVVTTTRNSISISWGAATDNVAVTGYDIYVNGSRSYTVANPLQTSFTVYGLTQGQNYALSVKAKDQAGNTSPASNQVTASAVLSGLPYTYYNIPTTLSNLPNFGTLTPASSGIMPNVSIAGAAASSWFAYLWQGYIIIPTTGNYTFQTSSDDGSRMWIGSLNSTTSPYTFSGTPLINNDGGHATQSVNSSVISLTAGIYPVAIAFCQFTGGMSMTLSWKTPGSSSFVAVPNSAFSDSVVVGGTAPAFPTAIKATATSYNKVYVTWTDNSANETGFEVYRSTSVSGPYTVVGNPVANAQSFTDSSVSPSTTYYYKVQAINTYGSSGFDPVSLSGLAYSYYQGAWNNLPNFNLLTPVLTGVLNNVSLSPSPTTTNYAFKFQGTIKIAAAGLYTFYTASDDGSNLYVGGFDSAHLVVKNDFLQGTTERSGTVTLAKGSYPIYITYFQQGGGFALTTSYAGPGITKAAIPDSVYANGNATTTTSALPGAPAAPTTLAATATGASVINLSWTNSASNAANIQVYRSGNNNQNYVLWAKLPGNAVSFQDTGLFANAVYYYKVNAVNPGGTSVYSNEVHAQTLDVAPVIVHLSARQVRYGTTTAIPLSATAGTSGTLTFSGIGLPAFASVTSNGNGTGSLTLNPASSDQGTYSISVKVADAFGGADTTTFSLSVNNNYPPTIDTIGNFTINENDTLTIPIAAHNVNPADTITISVSNLPNAYTLTAGANGTASLFLHPSYAAAGTYTVSVKAVDNNGYTTTRTFTYKVNYKDPSVHTYIRFAAQDAIGAPWNSITGVTTANLVDETGANTGAGLSMSPASWWSTYNGGPAGGGTGVYPDAVLLDYYYFGIFGGPDTVTSTLTGLDTSRLYNLTFYAGSSWSGVSDNGTTVYQSNNQTVQLYVQNNKTNTVSISSIKPKADGTISFRMWKLNAGTPVGYLNALVLTKQYDDGLAPAAPLNLVAVNAPGQGVKLNWQDVAYNETAYQIFRSTSQSTGFVVVGTVAAKVAAFTDSTVSGGVQYYYKVAAINTHGTSDYTATVSVTTTDRIPKINPIADVSLNAGQSVNVNVTTVDDATDHVSLTASNLPAFATFTDNGDGTGSISIQPGAGSNGVYSGITITATDLSDSSRSAVFNVFVVEQGISSTYINFTVDTAIAPRPWNNLTGIPFPGTKISNLVDDGGVNTGMSVTIMDGFDGVVDHGMRARNNTGVYPETVTSTGYFYFGTATKRLQISGLNASKRYNFVVFNSYYDGTNTLTNYNINGGTNIASSASYNSNKTFQFNGIAPDASGNATLNITRDVSASFSVITALVIQAYDPTVVTLMAPADLRVVNQTKKAIKLQWQDRAASETGYEVWRATSSTGSYTLLTSLPANSTSYVDSNLTSNAYYYYTVRVVNGTAHSNYTNTVAGYTYASTVSIAFNSATTPQAAAPWNNTAVVPQVGYVWNNFVNDQNQLTNVGMLETGQWAGIYAGNGVNTGNNSGVYPDAAMANCYVLFPGQEGSVQLTGLNLAQTYDFTFFSSATGTSDATSIYRVNGQSAVLNATSNSTGTMTIFGLTPDANGNIFVQVDPFSTIAQFGELGALVVKGYTANPSSAPVAPVSTTVTSQALTSTSNQFGVTTVTPTQDGLKVLTAYPNPFISSFTLAVPAADNDNILVSVADVSGKVMFQKRFEGLYQGTNLLTVQPGALAHGVYFVTVVNTVKGERKTIQVLKN